MHLSASPVHCHGMSDSRDSVCVVLGPAFQEMGGAVGPTTRHPPTARPCSTEHPFGLNSNRVYVGGHLVLRGTPGPRISCPRGTCGPRTSCPGDYWS